MSENFTEDFRFDATLTTDADLTGARTTVTANEVVAYLNADPRHAVVLHESKDDFYGRTVFSPELYVLRGAGEDLQNFYWGEMPAEDPNDAEGGDLTADNALAAATTKYWQ